MPVAAIKAVYLVPPPALLAPAPNVPSEMMDFVDTSRACGTQHFVLQTTSAIETGGPGAGKAHAYLRELGSRRKVDWAVAKPS